MYGVIYMSNQAFKAYHTHTHTQTHTSQLSSKPAATPHGTRAFSLIWLRRDRRRRRHRHNSVRWRHGLRALSVWLERQKLREQSVLLLQTNRIYSSRMNVFVKALFNVAPSVVYRNEV